MTNTPIQVTTDLSKVLEQIDRKLDKLDDKFDALLKEVLETKGNLKALDTKVDGIDKRVEKIESDQKALVKDVSDLKGAKSLIVPIIVAVTTSLLTLLIRAVPNP
jgi:predicted nuclease with TOPRIM domain